CVVSSTMISVRRTSCFASSAVASVLLPPGAPQPGIIIHGGPYGISFSRSLERRISQMNQPAAARIAATIKNGNRLCHHGFDLPDDAGCCAVVSEGVESGVDGVVTCETLGSNDVGGPPSVD